MTYTLSGGWTEVVSQEYDDLGEALGAADKLVAEHPEAVISVNGPGINVHRFTPQETVKA